MKIIFDAEKAIQAKQKCDTEIAYVHNKAIKTMNRTLACKLFLVIAPIFTAVIFIIYFIFYSVLTGCWVIDKLISENHWSLIAVLATSFTVTELCALVLYFLFCADHWWDPDNYPVVVKYHKAIENKTVLSAEYKWDYIHLVLEAPTTHIVSEVDICVSHLSRVLRSDITEVIIDLHDEVISVPYMHSETTWFFDCPTPLQRTSCEDFLSFHPLGTEAARMLNSETERD